jgi:hypothetical protein
MLARKVAGVTAAVTVVGVLIGLYVGVWASSFPRAVAATPVSASATGGAQLTLETVAAVGPQFSPTHPDWVSYLVQSHGHWVHSTIFTVPANSVVRVTIYQFDSGTGLRNPFLAEAQGTVGGMTVDGKPTAAIDPDSASHTFAVPELGVFVPLEGVPDDAKNPCPNGPCSLSYDHRTITFSFRTGKKGRYHWQCFVPCAAGSVTGNGAPMQTLGYMDGFLDVV